MFHIDNKFSTFLLFLMLLIMTACFEKRIDSTKNVYNYPFELSIDKTAVVSSFDADNNCPTDFYHVKDFGAQGSGEDETDKIQEAIDQAAVCKTELHFSSGKEYLVKGLHIKGNTKIIGHGAVIKKIEDNIGIYGNNMYVLGSKGAVTDIAEFWTSPPIKIDDIKIDASVDADYGLIISSWNSDISNIVVCNAKIDGILMTGKNLINDLELASNSMVNNRFYNIRIHGNGSNGIHILDPSRHKLTDSHIKNGFIYENGEWGIYSDAGAGMHISGLHFYQNSSGSIYLNSAGYGTIVDSICSEDTTGFKAAVQLKGSAPVMIQNSVFFGKVTHLGGGDEAPYGLRSVGNQYQGNGHLYHQYFSPTRKILSYNDYFACEEPFQWHNAMSTGEFVVVNGWLNFYGENFSGTFNARQNYKNFVKTFDFSYFIDSNKEIESNMLIQQLDYNKAYLVDITAVTRRYHQHEIRINYICRLMIQRKQNTDIYAITKVEEKIKNENWNSPPEFSIIEDGQNLRFTLTAVPKHEDGYGTMKLNFKM